MNFDANYEFSDSIDRIMKGKKYHKAHFKVISCKQWSIFILALLRNDSITTLRITGQSIWNEFIKRTLIECIKYRKMPFKEVVVKNNTKGGFNKAIKEAIKARMDADSPTVLFSQGECRVIGFKQKLSVYIKWGDAICILQMRNFLRDILTQGFRGTVCLVVVSSKHTKTLSEELFFLEAFNGDAAIQTVEIDVNDWSAQSLVLSLGRLRKLRRIISRNKHNQRLEKAVLGPLLLENRQIIHITSSMRLEKELRQILDDNIHRTLFPIVSDKQNHHLKYVGKSVYDLNLNVSGRNTKFYRYTLNLLTAVNKKVHFLTVHDMSDMGKELLIDTFQQKNRSSLKSIRFVNCSIDDSFIFKLSSNIHKSNIKEIVIEGVNNNITSKGLKYLETALITFKSIDKIQLRCAITV